MRKRIQDEFTDLPISRQRKYQLRKRRDNRCTECGEPVLQGSRCLKHLVRAREHQRGKLGLTKRYKCTLSYRLEEIIKKVKAESVKRPSGSSRRTAKTPLRASKKTDK